ncbi:dTDP-4-dehydrorhamnose reductase [Massilia sp. TS11]|uniref:dTDP-4-dehydrorhamnose reductase n=1 Tax=Massilia sp. TS11 TaxID=2908003 RepID=UPI001EDBF9B2|nr:dTDP-4-dehydrorhamnose reductase [Massilia sp. TS11]MCG2583472.1 dTDP-4-dehydrorhamnose reductase [Massilia sp. TS11]
MKILLTGVSGQVGYELERSLQGLGQVLALDRGQCDLARPDQVAEVVRRVRPDWIVNPAAYTAVDKAESERDLAFTINADSVGVLAREAKAIGATLVHYSTDYVFDGTKQGAYVEDDATNPLNVYGASKLAGEQAIAASGVPHLIFRTSWVYGRRGKNFLLTMQRLGREKDRLRVVADQHGAPTWSRTIADTTAHVLAQARAAGPLWWERHSGIYHLSARGQTTWCDFTRAIFEESGISCQVDPIATADYPTPAHRPANSVMDASKLTSSLCELPNWRLALHLCVKD